MTNKYLEKVAELDNGKVGYLATGVGAAVGGTIIGQKAGGPISRAVHEKPSIDKHTIKKLLRQNQDLNITTSHTKAMKGATQRGFENFSKNNIPAGPFFANKHFLRHYGSKTDKSLINMRDRTFKAKNVKNLDVLVHELGHARHEASINRGALRSALSSAAIAAKKYKLGTIGGAAMLTNEHTRDKAWVAPILQQARTLHREGMANYYGHKMLSKAGTPAMTKAFRRLAAKNMLGYSGATAAHSALLYAVGRLGKKHDK